MTCEAWCKPGTYAPFRKCSKHVGLRRVKMPSGVRLQLCPWHRAMVEAGKKISRSTGGY